MGYIKEPAGINFIVDPTPLTVDDRKMISEIIAYYKATGRKKPFRKPTTLFHGHSSTVANMVFARAGGQ